MGITVLTAIMILFSNLLADILYSGHESQNPLRQESCREPTDHGYTTNTTSANAARAASAASGATLTGGSSTHPKIDTRAGAPGDASGSTPGRCRLDLHLDPR